MSVKDQKLEEKEQFIVDGTIFADEFRNRKTGKRIEENTDISDFVVRHEFNEGTVLTDEILEEVKSGDIVKVLQMEFVVNNKVNQSPRSITGSIVAAISDNSFSLIKLDWVKGQALEPTMATIKRLHKHKVAGLVVVSTKSNAFTKFSDFWLSEDTISITRNGIPVLSLDYESADIELDAELDVYLYSVPNGDIEKITTIIDSSNLNDDVSSL